MIAEQLASQREQLLTHSKVVNEKADKLREELLELESLAHRIDSAISALDGKSTDEESRETPKKRRASKPTADYSEVVQLLTAIVKQVPRVSDEKLYELLEAQVSKQGYSRIGLKGRFREALLDGQFAASRNEKTAGTNQKLDSK